MCANRAVVCKHTELRTRGKEDGMEAGKTAYHTAFLGWPEALVKNLTNRLCRHLTSHRGP